MQESSWTMFALGLACYTVVVLWNAAFWLGDGGVVIEYLMKMLLRFIMRFLLFWCRTAHRLSYVPSLDYVLHSHLTIEPCGLEWPVLYKMALCITMQSTRCVCSYLRSSFAWRHYTTSDRRCGITKVMLPTLPGESFTKPASRPPRTCENCSQKRIVWTILASAWFF